MNDVKISFKHSKDKVEITIDGLLFLISLKSRNLKRISDTARLDRKINKLSDKADILLSQNKQNEYLQLRKKAVKTAVNHVMGMTAFNRLYKKYNDLATIESIARAINQQIINLCYEISEKTGGES